MKLAAPWPMSMPRPSKVVQPAGLRLAQELRLLGVVDDVGDYEAGPEHRKVGDEAGVVHGGHADAGGVRQDVARLDARAQGRGVVEVAEAYLAGRGGVAYGPQVRQRALPEGVALVEDADLLRALQRGLDGDGARRAARAQEGDGLAAISTPPRRSWPV